MKENERGGAQLVAKLARSYRSSQCGNCRVPGRRRVMNAPQALRMLLWPLSVLYGAGFGARFGVRARLAQAKALEAKVISVGNLLSEGRARHPCDSGSLSNFSPKEASCDTESWLPRRKWN